LHTTQQCKICLLPNTLGFSKKYQSNKNISFSQTQNQLKNLFAHAKKFWLDVTLVLYETTHQRPSEYFLVQAILNIGTFNQYTQKKQNTDPCKNIF
jgi:hypothetical protein